MNGVPYGGPPRKPFVPGMGSNGNGATGGHRNMDDEDRKLFLGGLHWETTEGDLSEYFSKYGTIESVSIKYDAVTRQPRGFGFITFSDESAIDDVLNDGTHKIRDKVIDPKRAKSRPICKKIFVGGVDGNMPEEDIKAYFSKYGRVEGIELPFDRVRGRRREFCFIIFETEEAADSACRNPKQTVGSRECDIKKAQPQPVAQQMKRQQQMAPDGRMPHHAGGGGGHPGNGHYDSRPPRGPPRGRPPMPHYDSAGGWQDGQGYDPNNWYGGYQQGPPAPAGPGAYPGYGGAAGGGYPPHGYGGGGGGGGGGASAGYDYGYGYPGYGDSGYGAGGYGPAGGSGASGGGWSGYPGYEAANDPYAYGAEGGYPPPLGPGSGPSSQSSSHSHSTPSSQSSVGKMNSRRIPGPASGYHPYPRGGHSRSSSSLPT